MIVPRNEIIAIGKSILKIIPFIFLFFIRQLPASRVNILAPTPPYGHHDFAFAQVARKGVDAVFLRFEVRHIANWVVFDDVDPDGETTAEFG